MASDLDSYLATRYLVADSKPTKKRKRKHPKDDVGLLITEDDDAGFGAPVPQGLDENDDGPAVVAGTSAEFRKAKKSSWKTLGGNSKKQPSTKEADFANAIIASAAAEQEASRQEDDEVPAVEGGDVVKMGDGTHAGLQSAAAVTAQLEKRQRQEREEFDKLRGSAKEEETAYRDAAGNRIDISMRRAQARRAAAEAAEKERQAKEALKGDAQKEEADRRKEKLQDAKLMPFARSAEDEEMNRELKEQQRWNDPMMQFLGDKSGAKGAASSKTKKGHPAYNGPAPPNRYGIRPGYRWDGVDRSNGFESERFKALNRREMRKDLEYSWQMDV